MGLENERKQLQKKLEQLEALLFVTFTFVEENRRNISSIRERLRSFTKTELKQAIGATDAFLKKMSDKFGLKSPLGEIVRFYKEIKAGIESGHVVYSGRWQCLQDFSKAHEIFCESWNELPNHVLLGSYFPRIDLGYFKELFRLTPSITR